MMRKNIAWLFVFIVYIPLYSGYQEALEAFKARDYLLAKRLLEDVLKTKMGKKREDELLIYLSISEKMLNNHERERKLLKEFILKYDLEAVVGKLYLTEEMLRGLKITIDNLKKQFPIVKEAEILPFYQFREKRMKFKIISLSEGLCDIELLFWIGTQSHKIQKKVKLKREVNFIDIQDAIFTSDFPLKIDKVKIIVKGMSFSGGILTEEYKRTYIFKAIEHFPEGLLFDRKKGCFMLKGVSYLPEKEEKIEKKLQVNLNWRKLPDLFGYVLWSLGSFWGSSRLKQKAREAQRAEQFVLYNNLSIATETVGFVLVIPLMRTFYKVFPIKINKVKVQIPLTENIEYNKSLRNKIQSAKEEIFYSFTKIKEFLEIYEKRGKK